MVNRLKKMKIENQSDALNTIEKIKNDCDKLEKKDDLTEYGKGQLGLINIVSKEIETKKSEGKKE